MNRYFYTLLCTVFLLFLYRCGFSQVPAFYHLTTTNGLYDNHVRSVVIDKQGFLWVGTEEGLNRYDGHSVTVYLKDKYPALPSDRTTYLFCDSRNYIWVGTAEGLAWLDNNRVIHRVVLDGKLTDFSTKAIIETKKWGVVLISSKGQYYFDEKKKVWQPIDGINNTLSFEKIKTVQSFDSAKALFVIDSSILLFNYNENKIVRHYDLPDVSSICKLQQDEIAAGRINGAIIILNSSTGKEVRKYDLTNVKPLDIKQAANGDIIIVAELNGLITIKPSGTISSFIHNPVNPTSLISNSTYRVATGANGEVVIGTSTSGISMYNTKLNQAGFTGFFTDSKGDYYDNYTGKMVEDADNSFWIGAYDRLIHWDKKSNSAAFYYMLIQHDNEMKRGDILSVCFDKKGYLWGSTDRGTIFYFSKATGNFTPVALDTSLTPVFKTRSVTDFIIDDDGLMWVCCSKGIFTINTTTKKADPYTSNPMVRELSGKIVNAAFIDSKKRMWFATIYDGVYCFEKNGNKLFHYTVKDSLPSDVCYMVKEDKKGRYYITTSKGMVFIDAAGVIHPLTRQHGLRYERCESVMIDDENMAWFSNKKCLVRFNADNNEMEFFDEKNGLLNDGFRVGSCIKASSGELLWGGYKGISYFDPQHLKNTILPLQVSIYNVFAKDSALDINKDAAINISYANNNITFGFAAVHLGIPGKTYYQYRLQGFDKDWQKGEDINQARYSALPSGSYTFDLKASIDGVHWVAAQKKISIVIVPPLWIRWWFITLAILLFFTALYWVIRNRNKKIKQHKEDLEAEQAINHFASSLHEQQTVETILWDVARNCIGRLQFEDCVVYLLDETKNVLVQKAAYGPKSPRSFQIAEPLEIPLGKGITGTVAVTGKPEIVNDTSKDNRYIVDDSLRLSEIAVPIVWGEQVIGVIDCEHHKKNYFTQKHLSILNTIASLCANKIVRAKAEEEKKKAQTILTNTEQKMAEVEMQALRAQMNPHFIFNCLNSINRYIVKSDQATASLYLTRFAKLIRLILDNSGNKNISLSNELEALKLYIEMEALRFDKKFSYQVIVDRNVNTDSIELPPLIIQPYVENAIWHGLLHKDGGGQLVITLKLIDEAMLECTIEDNGVGRSKAGELKSKSATSRKSLGMQLTENRLALLNRHAELNASITIIDIKNEHEQAAGTKVVLLIPV